MANVVDTDNMQHSVVSYLDLHSLLRPVCPSMKIIYGNLIKLNPLRNFEPFVKQSWPIKPFSCSTQMSMKFTLLINMKMPTIIFF